MFGQKGKDQCQNWHSLFKTLWARCRVQFLKEQSISNFACKLCIRYIILLTVVPLTGVVFLRRIP